MVDAVLFREKNPSYSFPAVKGKPSYSVPIDLDLYLDPGFCPSDYPTDSAHVGFPLPDFEKAPSRKNGEITKPQTSYTDEDLLLCKPTVFGFALSIKRWGEYSPSGSFQGMMCLINYCDT
jgi:hypothetical protein